ncbi:uncharacterized protein MELLADRAFT_86512 [Melampsora larici-populina 98AG31]|uniref:Uncharacterized protein n=1 Tax=Melampsora larici-populina (strain 98AG31 / pathotype 3-4-7) TaxID=747676 RepID=F4SDP0_MELLP|nr:uncharacterized protein MELLADRAFT_86512 [Melampsora larici-populina 98AG31]EGF97237.1 hypothetical protein MELLADRAFT_86512 [Melampsora larici-populina 98AG31]
MVVPTLVHERYQFIKDGHLPAPVKGGLVAILCPECSTPLRYHSALADAWRIHCPTLPKNNQHNWRTWRCDQLNHERALINAGAPRPIISSSADWGPRISPFGVPLDPKSANIQMGTLGRTNIDDHHPFLGREPTFTQLDSLVGPHRAKAVYPCQRASRGPVARTHRTAGNKGCYYQYCQACCLEFGLGPCPKHNSNRRPAPANTTDIQLSSSRPAPAAPTPAPTFPTPASTSTQLPEPARPKEPRPHQGPHPHQWAQASNTLGRRLGPQAVARIQINRRERYEAVEREIANKYDENKVITIHLWLDDLGEKIISAHFDQWPKARLDESSLLIQACTLAIGPSWNRALLFWDDKIDTWHETMVTFPHRFPASTKNIVVRSHNVDPSTPGLPQSKSKQGPSRARPAIPEYSAEHATSQASSHHVRPDASTRPTSTPNSDDDDVIVVSSSYPPRPTGHSEDVEVFNNPMQTPNEREISEPPVFDFYQVKHAADQAKPDSAKEVTPPTPSPTMTNAVKKKKWPGSSVLVSTLLAWYKECETRPPIQAWHDAFGAEWLLVPSTMYRYRLWIERVDYDRFSKEYKNKPRATVGEARLLYKKEFQIISNA